MKKTISLICAAALVLALFLGGCAARGEKDPGKTVPGKEQATVPSEGETAPSGTTPGEEAPIEPTEPTDPPSADPAVGSESSAFTFLFETCPDWVTAFLYNEPFRLGSPEATAVWNEGSYDRLYIVPRYVGMTVRAYAVTPTDDGDLDFAPEPSFTTVAEDGCVISASLARPEGFPAWYLETELPDGQRTGMLLEYNGRYGTGQIEFLGEGCMEELFGEPVYDGLINEGLGRFSEEEFWSFWHAADAAGLSFNEAGLCFSEITEIGDSAAYSATERGEFGDGSYSFRIARFHENYDPGSAETLADRVQGQYQTFLELGNESGILGLDPGDEDELYYQLTGLSVFNPMLAAREVEILVNGESLGSFVLSEDQFCTLVHLELPRLVADRPIEVQVRVLSTNFGAPEDALIYAEGGISGNISGAR